MILVDTGSLQGYSTISIGGTLSNSGSIQIEASGYAGASSTIAASGLSNTGTLTLPGGSGTDTLTGVTPIVGSNTGTDIFYVHSAEKVTGNAGAYNYVVGLSNAMNVVLEGTQYQGTIQEVDLNTGMVGGSVDATAAAYFTTLDGVSTDVRINGDSTDELIVKNVAPGTLNNAANFKFARASARQVFSATCGIITAETLPSDLGHDGAKLTGAPPLRGFGWGEARSTALHRVAPAQRTTGWNSGAPPTK